MGDVNLSALLTSYDVKLACRSTYKLCKNRLTHLTYNIFWWSGSASQEQEFVQFITSRVCSFDLTGEQIFIANSLKKWSRNTPKTASTCRQRISRFIMCFWGLSDYWHGTQHPNQISVLFTKQHRHRSWSCTLIIFCCNNLHLLMSFVIHWAFYILYTELMWTMTSEGHVL